VVYADPSFATEELGWRAELGMEQMCADSWRWISSNPDGFATTVPNAEKATAAAKPVREGG
jgi:UDP-glucose 4-epimerase